MKTKKVYFQLLKGRPANLGTSKIRNVHTHEGKLVDIEETEYGLEEKLNEYIKTSKTSKKKKG